MTPDGLLTEGPACTNELDTHSHFDSNIRIAPFRGDENGVAVGPTRDTHIVEGELPVGDLCGNPKKVSCYTESSGHKLPNSGLEFEPPSPKTDEPGNLIIEANDKGGHPDPVLIDSVDNICCETANAPIKTGPEAEVSYYEAVTG